MRKLFLFFIALLIAYPYSFSVGSRGARGGGGHRAAAGGRQSNVGNRQVNRNRNVNRNVNRWNRGRGYGGYAYPGVVYVGGGGYPYYDNYPAERQVPYYDPSVYQYPVGDATNVRIPEQLGIESGYPDYPTNQARVIRIPVPASLAPEEDEGAQIVGPTGS